MIIKHFWLSWSGRNNLRLKQLPLFSNDCFPQLVGMIQKSICIIFKSIRLCVTEKGIIYLQNYIFLCSIKVQEAPAAFLCAIQKHFDPDIQLVSTG